MADPIAKVLEVAGTQQGEMLERLLALMRMKSFTLDAEHPEHRDARWAVARALENIAKDAGLQTELVDVDGEPILKAWWLGAGEDAETIVGYGHGDVMPFGDLAKWTTDPEAPDILDGMIRGRGSADDLGQVMAMLAAIKACMTAHSRLPINFKLVIEFGEETGSAAFIKFARDPANHEFLKGKFVMLYDTEARDVDTAAITCGLRGAVLKEVTMTGPGGNLHSGSFGGGVNNPANGLCHLLGAMEDDAGKIVVPRFFDGVGEPSQAIAHLLEQNPVDVAEIRKNAGVDALRYDDVAELTRAMLFAPTLDFHLLEGGARSTIIPASAAARISARIAGDQDPLAVSAAIDEFLRGRPLRPGLALKIETLFCAPAMLVDPTAYPIPLTEGVLAQVFKNRAVKILCGGSIPALSVLKELGMISLMIGLALPDSNTHGPDECWPVVSFERARETTVRLFYALAA